MDYDRPRFYAVMQRAAAADRDVVDTVSGSPDWEPPTAIREGLHDYADAGASAFDYPPSAGLDRLRSAIAERRGVDRERVIVTNGAGEANYLVFAAALAANAGTEVLLTDPVYPYYPAKAALLDGTVRQVPVGPTGDIDPAAVRERASADTAAIVVNTPNNPTGAVYDRDTMAALAAVAEACDATLVSDEVYRRFDLSGAFTSAVTVSDDAVAVDSFSKAFASTGFRVGYAIVPPALRDAVTTRHMLVNVTGSRPAQAAVESAIDDVTADYYERNRERLRERRATLTAALDAVGADYVRPAGGFYILADLPGVGGDMAAAERLIEDAGVAAMPGETFGTTTDDWLRFALTTPRIDTAADRLRAFIN
jgi:aspartate/methionine/tyrosine aminotransferase